MKKITLIFLMLSFGHMLPAQTALISAFKSSYSLEADSNYMKAINSLTAVYKKDSYELNLRLGWLNYLKGDYSQSLEYYRQARQILPYSLEAKLGYVLPVAALGNWNEVIDIYEEILKTDPQNTLVNYRMGAIYYERKDYEKAYYHTEKVVNLYPFDYDSVILLAWINLQMGKLREAKVLFNKSLLILPDNTSAIEGLKLIQ